MKDYFGYAGKSIVVTGGSNGMGKTAVEMLLDLGATDITVLDFVPTDTKGVKFVEVDLSSRESIDKAFRELPGSIDKFFGFAGISAARGTDEKVMEVNLLSNVYIVNKYLYDRMAKGGAIAFVASTAGLGWLPNKDEYSILVDEDWDTALEWFKANEKSLSHKMYTVGKRALIYLSKSTIEKFYKEKEVRVNTISPGITGTQLKDDFYAPFGGNIEMLSHVLRGPIPRDAEPREMAEAIVFLNSDMASYIDGEELMVDGGLNAMYELQGMGKATNLLATPTFAGGEPLEVGDPLTFEDMFKTYAEAVGGGNWKKAAKMYAKDHSLFHDQGPTLSGNPPYFEVGRDAIGKTLQLIGSRGSKVEIRSIDGNVMEYDLVVVNGARIPCKGALTIDPKGKIVNHFIIPNGQITPPTLEMKWVDIES
jgi:NAD(P)-dependent dehydrogenase (short-subunit alcohol dehydrogenase family)